MRPLEFFSIAAAKRFIHSCWVSLSVAVLIFITMVCDQALLATNSVAATATPQAVNTARALIILTLVLALFTGFPSARYRLAASNDRRHPVAASLVINSPLNDSRMRPTLYSIPGRTNQNEQSSC